MIETFRSRKNRQFYFRVLARNGKTVAQSEGYTTARARDRGIRALVTVIEDPRNKVVASRRPGEQ